MRSKGYFLTVKTLSGKLIHGSAYNSLRETIVAASDFVSDMDNHSKVYRELTEMEGAFVGIYFPSDNLALTRRFDARKIPKHVIVTIRYFDLAWDEFEGFDGAEINVVKESWPQNTDFDFSKNPSS
jgi:hypothetical protein